MKTYMGLSIIFCVIGIFCVSACSVRGFLALVIGIIAFILAFGTLRTKKISEKHPSVSKRTVSGT